MTDYALRRKGKWAREGRIIYSRVPIGAELWLLKNRKKEEDILPSTREQKYVRAIGVLLTNELKEILKRNGLTPIDIIIAGSTNPNVMTFTSGGGHDYDIFTILNKEEVFKARELITRVLPGGLFMGKISDTARAVVPYTIKRSISFPTLEGLLKRTVNIDYCFIHPTHERYASVLHVYELARALSKHPELRKDIILTKYAIKGRKIDILHQGLTSAAVSFGIIRAGGRTQWFKQLVSELQRWVSHNINEKYRPFLPDPCLPKRNLYGNIPAQRGVINRIIYQLEDILGKQLPTKGVAKWWIPLNMPFPTHLGKLPQEIIGMVKRVAKLVWNKEYVALWGMAGDEQPFVTVSGNRLVVFLPQIPPRPHQRVYLPLHQISNKEEAVKRFKHAHPDWKQNARGYFYTCQAMLPDYDRIKQQIISYFY